MIFAQRNPKPCPILDVTEAGDFKPVLLAEKADLRTDLPGYRIYKQGFLSDEKTEIKELWQENFVAFLLGCSFSFEAALKKANIPLRHNEAGRNVPMYVTNIDCKPAGVFSGPMVVSMRAIPRRQVIKAVQITSRFPKVHGAPVQIGNPEEIGIKDINKPDFGDPPIINEGDIPVFWACGVTPQAIAKEIKPEIMITHSPGKMFVSDLKNEALAVL